MALKITNTEENKLLARKELTAELTFNEKATPSNAEVRKMIADQAKADEKTIVVNHIYTGFGEQKASVDAYIYNTVEDMKRVHPKKLLPKEEKKEEAKPAEAAPAEAKPDTTMVPSS